MTDKQPFSKDTALGEFTGNILEDLAKHFPPAQAAILLSSLPIASHWKSMERITLEGAHGFFYFVTEETALQILPIVSKLYEDRHRSKGYPGMFDGTSDRLPKVCMNAYYEGFLFWKRLHFRDDCFSIWLYDKIQIGTDCLPT